MDNFDLKKYLVENKLTENSKIISEHQENLNMSDVKSVMDKFIETESFKINTSRIFRTKQQIEDYIKKLSDDENVKVKFEYEGNILNIEAKSFRKNLDNFSNRLESGIKHLGDF